MPDDAKGRVNRIAAADEALCAPVNSFGKISLDRCPSKSIRAAANSEKVKFSSRRVATRLRALAVITRAVLFF